jgi:non-heme chloroperoxidase
MSFLKSLGGLALAGLFAASAAAQTPPPALPYKPHTVASPDGVKLAVQEWGNPQGPAILFIHGFAQSNLSWAKQVRDPALAAKYRMVTFDLRGHGQSDKPDARDAYQQNARWAGDVQAVMQALSLQRPVLVAWSYAGRVASDYLMAHGDSAIAGVNYVSAVTDAASNAGAPANAAAGGTVSPDLAVQIASTRAFLEFCFVNKPPADEFETMVAFNAMVPRYVRLAMLGRPTPYAETFAKLTVPVLVSHGTADRAMLPKNGEFTLGAIRGARASWYEGGGHMLFWESAGRFNTELSAFVDGAQRR